MENLGFGTCSKCHRENQPIKIRWYDVNQTQCCVECYNEIDVEIKELFKEKFGGQSQ